MITLGVYLLATALTALSFAPWWFFLFRFFTGVGIGGEYAAINSAIDELIPSRYWAGAAAGALITVPATSDLSAAVGWRVCFGLGVVLGLVILLVRRNVPESPPLTVHPRPCPAGRGTGGRHRGTGGPGNRREAARAQPVDHHQAP
jgi:MFS family permease